MTPGELKRPVFVSGSNLVSQQLMRSLNPVVPVPQSFQKTVYLD